MQIKAFQSAKEAIEALALAIVDSANVSIKKGNYFNFVLTGGSSPKALYTLLSTRYKEAVDWTKVYFFMGDERHVPYESPDYNGGMARETLLDPLNIAESQIFMVNTALYPEEAASDYYERIAEHFNGETISFDFTLLGMGADAHTASIFPGTSICNSKSPGVEAVYVEKLTSWRISMTVPLINQSKNIAFLAFGKEKAVAFSHVQNNPNNIQYPASLIQGNVLWYVDGEIEKS